MRSRIDSRRRQSDTLFLSADGKGGHPVKDVLWNAVIAAVFTVGAMGVISGLVIEFGGLARVPARWRRFIGWPVDAFGPAHPRVWILAIALGLLLVLEVPVYVRVTEALAKSDVASVAVLGLHVVAVGWWIAYLWWRPHPA